MILYRDDGLAILENKNGPESEEDTFLTAAQG